jgi:membrane-bound lytic murein transglycosylase A
MSFLLATPRRCGAAAALALAALLAGCAGVPLNPPRPAPVAVPPSAGLPPDAMPAPAPGAALLRPRARWQPVDWAELPGWEGDRVLEAWGALYRSCERPPQGWSALCAEVLLNAPADESAARAWLQARLQPYRVESPEGAAEGLVTGYYEPLIEASRLPRGAFAVPLHRPPADLGTRKPYWTRQQLDTLPAAAAALRGREIAYVTDPLDALVLQIQGSGRLRITEADGRQRTVRLAFAGHNDQPYKSVGRWLIEQGEIRSEQASWPGIKAWARANPKRVQELLWSNPRVVFFREEPLADPQAGPRGAQGVALTPGRSIAVDPQSIPYGTPVWLSSTEPLSTQALQRLVVAQDTGSAIVGAVRADFFWGWGEQAEQQAGRMKQPLRLWVLWPRGPQS